MLDDDFPVKQCLVEYEQGVYHKISLTNRHITTAADSTTQVKWTAALQLQIEPCFQINCDTDLILSDIKEDKEPK